MMTLYKQVPLYGLAAALLFQACSDNTSKKSMRFDPNGYVTAESGKEFDETVYVSGEAIEDGFPLAVDDDPASLVVSPEDFPGVQRVSRHLQQDIYRVTGSQPDLATGLSPETEHAVLIGTVGKSPVIDRLVEAGKIDVSDIEGRWESFLIQVVNNPLDGVDMALVIAGSDKRGTIYGMYDLSEKMGVSPWYWWADVPIVKQETLYVKPGRRKFGEPKVKYRGIFINDEAPALSGWAYEKFGGFNSQFYEKVYELILRMKGNYLWPAMWGRSLFDDDSLSAPLADEYGVVLGTTHHEPLMRAHVEWDRYGSGDWNYETNEETLKKFWREGIRRMNDYESIVSIGMRGDGDQPMTEGTAIALLERIVKDQREIIEEVTGKEAEDVPQMWALYKEVQDYYDKGMRVPDDVTLLLCDDNWGNIRKLPDPDAEPRQGGYGIYYHFDYVGGPRNYKWLNTNQIERTWEQMHLAYRHGADRVWIVNVGDIKPMEFPTQFFLDYAWDPEQWPAERLPEYTRRWAKRQFGHKYADIIAGILDKYTKYNSRKKPELLSPETYSLTNYREAERIIAEYNRLAEEAERIYGQLPAAYRDAYYQLVLFPVQACANLNELYVAAGKNRLYAQQGRAATNEMAERVKFLFDRDAELTEYFHTELAGGKWNHIMSQTHIGYTYWQQPEQNNMPEVQELAEPDAADMGVSAEGSEAWYPRSEELLLPEFDPYHDQTYRIEVFNRGKASFEFHAEAAEPWLEIQPESGTVEDEISVEISVNWENAAAGKQKVPITISGPEGMKATVWAPIHSPAAEAEEITGFVESNGYIAIEAAHFNQAVSANGVQWQIIPNLGRTLSAVTPVPVVSTSDEPGDENGPRLEYQIHTFNPGPVKVRAYLSPTLDFFNSGGLRYAVSIDNEKPQVVDMHSESANGGWDQWVSDNIIIAESEHVIAEAGNHTLKFWMVDPGVALQKLVVDFGGAKESYLGPPESFLNPEQID